MPFGTQLPLQRFCPSGHDGAPLLLAVFPPSDPLLPPLELLLALVPPEPPLDDDDDDVELEACPGSGGVASEDSPPHAHASKESSERTGKKESVAIRSRRARGMRMGKSSPFVRSRSNDAREQVDVHPSRCSKVRRPVRRNSRQAAQGMPAG
jgi:hypothetical protein